VAKSMHLKISKPSRLDQKLPLSPHPPKADTSSKGGHSPALSTMPLAWQEGNGDLITNILRLLACLLTFSAGPIIWRQFAWLSSQKHEGKQDVEN